MVSYIFSQASMYVLYTWKEIRGQCRGESGCYGKGCGYYGSKWIVAGGEHGYDACFMPPKMRLVLARPENAPGSWLEVGGAEVKKPGQASAVGPKVKLLDGLRCARDLGACDCALARCEMLFMRLRKVGTSNPGGMRLEEVAHAMGLVGGAPGAFQLAQDAFRLVDKDGDGIASLAERTGAADVLKAFGRNASHYCPNSVGAGSTAFGLRAWCKPLSSMYVTRPGGLVPRVGSRGR